MRTDTLHTLPSGALEVASPPAGPEPVATVNAKSVALIVIAIGAAIFILQQTQSVLVPFVLGLLLFYAPDPMVDWLQKMLVPRVIGAALALALAIGSVEGLLLTPMLMGKVAEMNRVTVSPDCCSGAGPGVCGECCWQCPS